MPPKKRAAPASSNKSNGDGSKKQEETDTTTMSKLKITSLLVLLVAIAGGYVLRQNYVVGRVRQQFDADNLLPFNYPQRTWGSLRSSLYFGLKTMSPDSVVAGMMWFRNRIEHNTISIKHWCSQHDGLQSYTYLRNDFDTFGVQRLVDRDLNITTSHLIDNQDGSWSARISFERDTSGDKNRLDEPTTTTDEPVSLVFYVATDNEHDTIATPPDMDKLNSDNFYVTGTSGVFSDFHVAMSVESGNVLYRGYLHAHSDPPLVHFSETLLKNIYVMTHGRDQLFVIRDSQEQQVTKPNMIAHQIVFRPPLIFNAKFTPRPFSASQQNQLTFPQDELDMKSAQFDEHFEKTFNLKAKHFKANEIDFARNVLSNMIGGIGYFYGSAKVQAEGLTPPLEYGPLQLLTAVPSRSFFPRGFLWDEGFHHLLIARYKPALSVQILKSWLNLINVEGWIPREVILGAEAEARVPAEFVVQKNKNANPPTLFLAIESLMQREQLSDEDLQQLYPRLNLWYNWFNASQVGAVYSSYRWRGRDANAAGELNPKTLTSGLDDYPRATHPDDHERHVDLRSWMALASRVMYKIASRLKLDELVVQAFKDSERQLADNALLDELHWSGELNCYADYGMHSTNVRLARVVGTDEQGRKEIRVLRETVQPPSYQLVPECGYVGLFPLMLQLIEPTNEKLGLLLDTIRDENGVWSKFGIRSLSKRSLYYQTHNTPQDPPYWRGAIWINLNYLTLRALNHYGSVDGPYQAKAKRLYGELRANLVSNMIKQYESSGYIWEQYDDRTGKGKGSHPFTGWSALVVLIMAEEY